MARQKLLGTPGDDTLMGNSGNQSIIGLAGNDLLNTGGGYDYIEGGPGNDTIVIDNPLNTIKEKPNQGTDLIISSSGVTIPANIENVTLIGAKTCKVNGNSENNILLGNSGDNSFNGFAGNDTIKGGDSKDKLDGFSGDDNLSGDNGNDFITGGSGNDILTGGTGNDILLGDNDNDNLNGDVGNDSLNGGKGSDILTGGPGNDQFTLGLNGVDQILDFLVTGDRIFLPKSTFTTISSNKGTGFSNNTEFFIGTSDNAAIASPADIAYNTANGKLFYNNQQILTLSGGPDITASNFILG